MRAWWWASASACRPTAMATAIRIMPPTTAIRTTATTVIPLPMAASMWARDTGGTAGGTTGTARGAAGKADRLKQDSPGKPGLFFCGARQRCFYVGGGLSSKYGKPSLIFGSIPQILGIETRWQAGQQFLGLQAISAWRHASAFQAAVRSGSWKGRAHPAS